MRYLIAAALTALVLPGSAVAATATSDGTNITVTSAPGESIRLSVGGLVPRPGQLEMQVLLPATLQAGPGCLQRAGSTASVLCSYSGAPRVVVDLGDGDDGLAISNVVPMRVEATGGPGNDSLGGDDVSPDLPIATVLDGGPGDDTLTPGHGPDTLRGGDGTDTVGYEESVAPTSITLNGAADDGPPGEGDDVGSDFEKVFGSETAPNAIVATGVQAPLRLYGGDAADRIDGGGSDDLLGGEAGDDTIAGGPGDDGLLGEGGADRLHGGPGVDTFYGADGDDTLLARDGEADHRIGCDEGRDTAVLDTVLDSRLIERCERIDEAWIGPPRVLLRRATLTVHRGRLRLPVVCLAARGARCNGRIVVKTKRCVRTGRRCRRVVLARAKVNLNPDGRRTLAWHLSAKALRVVRGGQGTRCVFEARLRGGPRTVTGIRLRVR